MRLRNLFVLGAFTAMSFSVISCGKKAEEVKPADSMMTPAPAPAPTPAPTPVPVDSVKGEQQKKDADQMKKDADKMKKEGEKKSK
ncbi:MAG: hypothetical protein Q8916_00170 [Bacteroidota bacterium]|nr:hypothetical protein [Bacteroidota bacterium]MDP4228801.1 hypothetical protein [Bacteroidota bacterium]MDP4237189.1 hypothetical protein [Bacteroidota bacterium]